MIEYSVFLCGIHSLGKKKKPVTQFFDALRMIHWSKTLEKHHFLYLRRSTQTVCTTSFKAAILRNCNNSGRHTSPRRLSSIYFSAHLSWGGDRTGLKRKRLFVFVPQKYSTESVLTFQRQTNPRLETCFDNPRQSCDGQSDAGVAMTWHRHWQARARGAGGRQKRAIRANNETQVKIRGQKKLENKGRKHKGRMTLL